MKILEQVIDAMIEGSDHKALKKTLGCTIVLRTMLTWWSVASGGLEHKRRRRKRSARRRWTRQAPATPTATEPKLELEADVEECPSTPELEESRPDCAPENLVLR